MTPGRYSGVAESTGSSPAGPGESEAAAVAAAATLAGHVAARDIPRLSAERLAGIIAMAGDAVVSVDEQQRITLFNHSAERMFGYAASEVIGRPLDVLVPEHFRRAHGRQVDGVREGPPTMRRMTERGEIYGRRKNGDLFPCEASISKFEVDGAPVLTAVVRDVSERREFEERNRMLLARESVARMAAQAAERRAAFLAEVSSVLEGTLELERTLENLAQLLVPSLAPLCVVKVLASSGERRARVGVADPEHEGLARRMQAFAESNEIALLSRTVFRGRSELVSPVTEETLVERATNDEHLALLRDMAPTSYVAVPMRAHGIVLGAITLVTTGDARRLDPGDLAMAEEIAARAGIAVDNARLYRQAVQASTLRDHTMGVVSHDLRGPLAAVGMAARGLERVAAGDPSAREALQAIEDATQYMQRLIQDLLDVASIEAGRFTLRKATMDPVILLVRATDMFERAAAERDIKLQMDLPEHLPTVVADADRLLQLMINILDNALKFTPPGGRVIVRACEAEGAALCIEVEDSGSGIPAEELPHIFDRFWHADRESQRRGTGLGLAIAKQIAEAHQGRIEVSSAVGRGTTFRVVLLVQQPDTASPAPT